MNYLDEAQRKVLNNHRELDIFPNGFEGGGETSPGFISGWRTKHPVRYQHFEKGKSSLSEVDGDSYGFISDSGELREKIIAFHSKVDGVFPESARIFIGPGSSPLVTSVLMALAHNGCDEIFYVPPVYHTLYIMSDFAGIRLRKLDTDILANHGDDLVSVLPQTGCTLYLTDPIWITGKYYSRDMIVKLEEWQTRTGSLIFVDGTFQYLKWDQMESEFSSLLNPELTIRLVCPTKSLGIHGVRFSYLILPSSMQDDVGWCCTKMIGSTSMYDRHLSKYLMDQLLSKDNNRQLVEYIKKQYKRVMQQGLIVDPYIEPNCCYYVFGNVDSNGMDLITMNGRFYELDTSENEARVNLMSPELFFDESL